MTARRKPTPAFIQKLLKQRDAEWKRLRSLATEHYIAQRMSILDAMTDCRYAEAAAEMIVMAGMTALGEADLTCLCCRKKWTLARTPAALVCIEFRPGPGGILAALCPDCALDDNKLKAALETDFGGNPQKFHDPGSA